MTRMSGMLIRNSCLSEYPLKIPNVFQTKARAFSRAFSTGQHVDGTVALTMFPMFPPLRNCVSVELTPKHVWGISGGQKDPCNGQMGPLSRIGNFLVEDTTNGVLSDKQNVGSHLVAFTCSGPFVSRCNFFQQILH